MSTPRGKKRIAIIGAGPTGLGAALRLQQLGHKHWLCFEQHNYVGGLSSSFRDPQGFLWEVGGHVHFSSNPLYQKLFHQLLQGEYLTHERQSWIRLLNSWVPYPFQNNLRYLPPEVVYECLIGLLRAQRSPMQPQNFKEWILATFGDGIARYFMVPNNEKSWAFPLEQMSHRWISERVAVIDLEKILKNIILELDDTGWGGNRLFHFPSQGGSATLFQRIYEKVKEHVQLQQKVLTVNWQKQFLQTTNGSRHPFDFLISSMPITELAAILEPPVEEVLQDAKQLQATGGHFVGVGLQGAAPEGKCWQYFPESNCPFYRVTYLSNYAPHNAPTDHYSLLCEVSFSDHSPLDSARLEEQTIQGLINSGMITPEDRHQIVSVYSIQTPYSYPVPSLQREAALGRLIPWLEQHQIFTRGRFGLWLYEIGNMDHSVLQGMELINRLLKGEKEQVISPFSFLNL